jgi:hypothetical protein
MLRAAFRIGTSAASVPAGARHSRTGSHLRIAVARRVGVDALVAARPILPVGDAHGFGELGLRASQREGKLAVD